MGRAGFAPAMRLSVAAILQTVAYANRRADPNKKAERTGLVREAFSKSTCNGLPHASLAGKCFQPFQPPLQIAPRRLELLSLP